MSKRSPVPPFPPMPASVLPPPNPSTAPSTAPSSSSGNINPPPPKKIKEESEKPANAPTGEVDPEQLGDVLNAAGVDLREEESLLNNGLMNEPGGLAGARILHAPTDTQNMLLNTELLRKVVSKITTEHGLRIGVDDHTNQNGLNQDPLSLLSSSCEEWLMDILGEAAMLSRHRRLALNPTNINEQNEISRALRRITKREQDEEEMRISTKSQLGIGENTKKPEKENEKDSEETMQRAANDTARMMTAAVGRKKKFSWMSDSAAPGASSSRLGASRAKSTDPAKFREIKEENGIVMRDILPVLENKHMGVKRALMRGYNKLRN